MSQDAFLFSHHTGFVTLRMMSLDEPSEQLPLKAAAELRPGLGSSGISRPRQQQQRAATFTAFVGLGLASWLLTNVTYVELGLFLRELPEHYRIYAYSVIQRRITYTFCQNNVER